jgi:hypothetical protein
MGEMAEFDAETGRHHVRFLDDSAEWVTVVHSPFEDYVSYHRGRARAWQLESSIHSYPLYSLDRDGDKSIMQPDDCGDKERLLQVRSSIVVVSCGLFLQSLLILFFALLAEGAQANHRQW